MIKILSKDTINKISSGEIIESPFNVVKELVENALDAKSSYINIEIKQSGKKFIRVIDNGCGMNKKDLELSIRQHATSKIRTFDDLWHITSLGFRGEALAAIITVSKLTMKTRQANALSGWELCNHDNYNIKISPWYGQTGTIVEVEDLFYNIPVRQKFLKTNSTEFIKILQYIEKFAIANYNINFKLFNESKLILFTTSVNNRINRIINILGNDFGKRLHNLNISQNKMFLDIYYTDKNDSLNHNKFQYLFVNSRPVKYTKLLKLCIYQAYKQFIPHNKHPGILIYLDINADEIDVNIHPMKHEVKLLKEDLICEFIYKNLINKLNYHNFLSISTANTAYKPTSKILIGNNNTSLKELWSNNIKYLKVIGQIFNIYFILENSKDQNIYIFDQHSVSERIQYEQYLTELENHSIIVQKMLIPEIFDTSISLSNQIKDNLHIFNKLGIYIEEFGKNAFKITGYPAALGNVSLIKNIVMKILFKIQHNKNYTFNLLITTIVSHSCHTSIRANDQLSNSEIIKLISKLFECKDPFACPHGRPTSHKISITELKKIFKR
ncbi:MAG: DNA mismatch repair endonuclease MutL [Endomicrobium sp.]|jgi:DNA mismatch repair protein MutL|nr:DNA mismatch repair endonuclease MutL [Endomicrobium sp.]